MIRTTKKISKAKKAQLLFPEGNIPAPCSGASQWSGRRVQSQCREGEIGLYQARKMGADVVLFPELMVTGYPPEDLLLKKKFYRRLPKNVKKNRSHYTWPDSRCGDSPNSKANTFIIPPP